MTKIGAHQIQLNSFHTITTFFSNSSRKIHYWLELNENKKVTFKCSKIIQKKVPQCFHRREETNKNKTPSIESTGKLSVWHTTYHSFFFLMNCSIFWVEIEFRVLTKLINSRCYLVFEICKLLWILRRFIIAKNRSMFDTVWFSYEEQVLMLKLHAKFVMGCYSLL